MARDKEHSRLIKELRRLRIRLRSLVTSSIMARDGLSTVMAYPYWDYEQIPSYVSDLDEARQGISMTVEQIKAVKKEIVKVQRKHSETI